MNQLVLYEKVYDLLLYIYPIIDNYPKREKFTLQTQTKNCLINLEKAIIRANNSTAKKSHLYEADVLLEELRLLIRLAHDLAYLTHHRYEVISRKVTEIGKLLGGLIKHVQGK